MRATNYIIMMPWIQGFKILFLVALLPETSLWTSINAAQFDGIGVVSIGNSQPINYYVASNGMADDSSVPVVLDDLFGIRDSPLQEADSGYLIDEQQPKFQDRLAYLVADNDDYQQALDAPQQLNAIESKRFNDFIMGKMRQHEEEGEEDNNNNILVDQENGFISDPINNPVEFANKNFANRDLDNHEANGGNSSDAILDNLVSIYLSDHPKDERTKQLGLGKIKEKTNNVEKEASDENANNNNEQSTTTELDDDQSESSIGGGSSSSSSSSSSSGPLASRYGNAEYIDHPLAIIGHQYMQGGAGEGRQLLGPEGTFENVQVIKTDRAVPSYCDPPNPCPIGYTAEDGCLENFINSASFSREYQAKQQCSCDNEHSLFNCASPVSTMKSQLYSSVEPSSVEPHSEHSSSSENTLAINNGNDEDEEDQDNDQDQEKHHHSSKLETLARTIQNRFGDLDSVRNLITAGKEQQDELDHNGEVLISRVAKKAPRVESDFRY